MELFRGVGANLLIPEWKCFIAVFAYAGQRFLLRDGDWSRDCAFTQTSSFSRPSLCDEKGVTIERHMSPEAPLEMVKVKRMIPRHSRAANLLNLDCRILDFASIPRTGSYSIPQSRGNYC
jgi:hypothetical protein